MSSPLPRLRTRRAARLRAAADPAARQADLDALRERQGMQAAADAARLAALR